MATTRQALAQRDQGVTQAITALLQATQGQRPQGSYEDEMRLRLVEGHMIQAARHLKQAQLLARG